MRLLHELYYAGIQAFRTLIPLPEDRTPISFSALPYFVVGALPFLFLAYLARRPDTYLIRLLLLPAVVVSALAAPFRFVWTIPALNVYNWAQCLFAEVYVAKAFELALTKEGMLKVGETRAGDISSGALYDALELSLTLRGVGWKFGEGVYIPKETRPLARGPFLRATLASFVKNFLLLDLLESALKLFPAVGTPLGGTMFYPTLAPPARYAVSTAIHLLTGSALIAGFHMVYALATLLAVGALAAAPAAWPPVFDAPFAADSLHAFWARRWHQLLRATFLAAGGRPGGALLGRAGLVGGTFAASAAYHEGAIYAMGRGLDARVPLFFAAQGALLLGERAWRRATGRRVRGWAGRAWVYFVLFVLAQPMVDAWHRRGMGGGMVIPPFVSPARLVLLPLLQRALHNLR